MVIRAARRLYFCTFSAECMGREWREKNFSENLQVLRTHLKNLRFLYPSAKLPIQAIQAVKAGELSGSDVIELVIKLGTHIDLASRDMDFLSWGDDHIHRDQIESILFRKVDFETLDTLETHVKVLERHVAFLQDSETAPLSRCPAAPERTEKPSQSDTWARVLEFFTGLAEEKLSRIVEAIEKAPTADEALQRLEELQVNLRPFTAEKIGWLIGRHKMAVVRTHWWRETRGRK